MDSGKTEKQETAGDPKARRKRRLKKLACWLVIDLCVLTLVFFLLLYRPGRYQPLDSGGFKRGQVSPYLTQLSADIYNGAQLREPFEVAVGQGGINDIIARWESWPLEQNEVLLYDPAVVFEPGMIVLMGTANYKGMELVVTIEIRPKIDDRGLLNLEVAKMKVGAMNLTPLAKAMAKRMYKEQVAGMPIDSEAWQTKIAASLLTGAAFEPVFPTGDKKIRVRVEEAAVEKERLVLRLTPIL